MSRPPGWRGEPRRHSEAAMKGARTRSRNTGHVSFKTLQERVAREYEGQPIPEKYRSKYGTGNYSRKQAEEIGADVAANQYRRKYKS